MHARILLGSKIEHMPTIPEMKNARPPVLTDDVLSMPTLSSMVEFFNL